MREHPLEVADVFHAHQNESFRARAMPSRTSSGRCCAISVNAEPLRSALISNDAIVVTMRLSLYDSCRNRHCPMYQSSARDRWLMKQASSLLPAPYAHVIFTVPEQLPPLALRNQQLFYTPLFRAAFETLLEIAADPRHLGARIRVLAVLHTWS